MVSPRQSSDESASGRSGRRPRVRRRRRGFTLLEVVIAVAIFGLSLGLILSIVSNARSRLLRAERSWAREHLFAQAAEFYLLAGPDADVPAGLLPLNFSCACTLEAAEDLPEGGTDPLEGWVLGRFHISVTGRSGEGLEERVVEKMMRAEDLQ